MDLKDVIEEVTQDLKEAQDAYRAGHPETAVKYLNGIRMVIEVNVLKNDVPAGDITESPTSEQPIANSDETPAQVPGPEAKPAAGSGPP